MSAALVSFYDFNDYRVRIIKTPSMSSSSSSSTSPDGSVGHIGLSHSLSMDTSLQLSPPLSTSTASSTVSSSCPASKEHKKLDRSISEPVDKLSNLNQRLAKSNSSRYKTELCRPFEENGTCKYGDKCQFAHGMHELRNLQRHPKYKTELCRTFHTTGFCPYGPRCHFIHNSEESKKNLILCLSKIVASNDDIFDAIC